MRHSIVTIIARLVTPIFNQNLQVIWLSLSLSTAYLGLTKMRPASPVLLPEG